MGNKMESDRARDRCSLQLSNDVIAGGCVVRASVAIAGYTVQHGTQVRAATGGWVVVWAKEMVVHAHLTQGCCRWGRGYGSPCG